jgi:hypothetical protein
VAPGATAIYHSPDQVVRTVLGKPAALLLIILMAIGSIAMWVAVPVFWLWLGSKLSEGSQPSLGPYVLVLAGIPISMVVIGKLLSALNRAYAVVTGRRSKVRVTPPWRKSMRGERGSTREATVLDVVMVISVSLALAAFAVWFFAFAGSSLPS